MSSASLIGVSAKSGVPLFVRHVGSGKPPPYALIGSLNGVHVFGEAQGVTLWNAASDSATVMWKTYHDSIRLILVRGSEYNSEHLDNIFLDLAFASLILLVGLNNLLSQVNVERLKKDIRSCFPLLDELLGRSLGCKECFTFSHLVRCADYVLPPDQLNIQPELDKYTEEADSSYGCIMRTSGQILFATKSFWALSNNELVVIPLLLSTKPIKMSVGRDIPIYLPDRSPNVPFRLIVIRLAGPLLVLSLCGPSPSLSAVIKSATIFWGSHFLSLDGVAAASICSLPPSMHALLDQSILGLLLVNYDTKRCLSCLHLKGESRSSMNQGIPKSSKVSGLKANLLSSFYRSMIGSLFHPPAVPPDDLPSVNMPSNHNPTFAYVTTDDFKLVLSQRSSHHLLLLFPALLPIHIARDVTRKAFDILTKGKGARL